MGEMLPFEQIKKGNSNMMTGLENTKLKIEQIMEILKLRD